MNAKARQMFFETEVPELMEKFSATTHAELNDKLIEQGSSMALRQQDFIDAMLGHLFLRGKVEKDPAVSLSEIVAYYQDNRSEYENPARARWEQLTVRVAKFSSKQAAYDEIWSMGREAFFGGSMQSVARARSQEPFADQGGVHDWTSQGSLVSQVLDDRIFTIPIGKMSRILEDETSFHIIKVLERTPAGVTPLAEVQEAIEDRLRKQKVDESQEKALAEIRSKIPVWTMFPEDVPGSKPLLQLATGEPTSSVR